MRIGHIDGAETPRPEGAPAAPSTLGSAYWIFGSLTLVGAVLAIIFGALNGSAGAIVAGAIGILSGVLFFGMAEFFEQIARIAAATEETARLLRQRLVPPG
jgi:hypothetical protein